MTDVEYRTRQAMTRLADRVEPVDLLARLDQEVRWSRTSPVRRVALAAAVTVLVVVLCAALARVIGAEVRTAPPVAPRPTGGTDAAFLRGDVPVADDIRGVWRVDNGTTAVRFSASGTASVDDRGGVFDDPILEGPYTLSGDQIRIEVTSGRGGCAGRTIVLRAAVPDPGGLHVVHTRAGTGGCVPEQAGKWVLEHLVAIAPDLESFEFGGETGWLPLVSDAALHGLWVAQGGGYVLEVHPAGAYVVVDGSGDPVDRGRWRVRGAADLVLTSSAFSSTCADGDRLVLAGVEQVNPGTRAIRGTVRTNTCGAPWTPATWWLVPQAGR